MALSEYMNSNRVLGLIVFHVFHVGDDVIVFQEHIGIFAQIYGIFAEYHLMFLVIYVPNFVLNLLF